MSNEMSRRDLVLSGVAVAAGLMPTSVPSEQDVLRRPMPMRTLGRTGARVSIIGFGSAPLGHSFQTQEVFDRVVGEALDLGINYLDTATTYDVAQERLGPIVTKRRRGLFIATKTRGRTKDQALKTVEESLRLLQTDHVDLVHLHNIGDLDVERLLDEDSPLRGLQEARRRGWLRFIGASGHQRVEKMAAAAKTGAIDVIMPALNFVDQHTYAYDARVLPEARKRRLGIVAMKVLGGVPNFNYRVPVPCLAPREHVDNAIRYALGLPGVCAAVIGFTSVEQVRQAVQVAKSFKPLSSEEAGELTAAGKRLSESWAQHMGPV